MRDNAIKNTDFHRIRLLFIGISAIGIGVRISGQTSAG